MLKVVFTLIITMLTSTLLAQGVVDVLKIPTSTQP